MIKRKWLISLTTVALAGSLFSTAALAKEDNGKSALVALGDSITFGYNLENNNHHVSRDAFPFVIGNDASLRVRDLGVPGWTTVDLLSSLQSSSKFQQAVEHADYITLDIGSNDLLHAISDGVVTSEEIYSVLNNLKAIILEIRSLTDAPIVVYNIYNPFQVNDPRHLLADSLLPIINSQITGLVLQLGDTTVVVADAYSAIGDNQVEYILENDIHPTVEGQKKLAEIGLEALHLNE